MSKTNFSYYLLKKYNIKLQFPEKNLLEINLLVRVYHELSKIFQSQYKKYQQLIKSNPNQEEHMSSMKFMPEMIKDILSTKEYTMTGIANQTHIPEEVLFDVVSGINNDTTFETSIKIFELHISVRRNLYDEIMRKIALEYLTPIQ